MKKTIILIISITLILFLTGCQNDANDEDKKLIIMALQNKNILSSNVKEIGKTTIQPSLDTAPVYDLDIYDDNGNLFAINFNKIYIRFDNDPKDCEYVISVYSNVTVLKDQEHTIKVYNADTKETTSKIEIRDDYILKDSNLQKYCGNKVKKIFGKDYIELSSIN